jgi:protein-tyrosine phosphatase
MEDRVRALVDDVGIGHFVDLSSRHDWMPAYRNLLPPQCAYTRYEIVDRRLPEDSGRLKQVVRSVIAGAAAGQIAYLHCQAGLGRTGTVVGVLLREMGFAGQDALRELVRLRGVAGLHEGSPEFEAQRQFVRDWTV